MPGIARPQPSVRISGTLAPTLAWTRTFGEPSAFIVTTDHWPLRTFQSSVRPPVEVAAQNVCAAGIAGRPSPGRRAVSILNGSRSTSEISSWATPSR